ncbi:cation transporting protein [Grosmannia clavigera kw1407]|uniref:Cation transporting protein n=1 Tax=Grosmannia clavigera (strain kw1407 / UAMH 11150) TaxID=655863 RepID=F0XJ11_GROCL|nr:cation transporting protein [Grosmannia clavigera kw1407]EFX02155.1 cation transporting protein [Grosmannia clavigera kw1407]
MAPSPLVDNAQIKGAELLNPLTVHYHAYHYERYIGAPEWTFVWVGSIITVQSLIWLSTNWSVNVKAIFTATRASSVESARLIKVIPVANAGAPEICKLERHQVAGKPVLSFLFQKRRFLYSPETKSFATLAYEVDVDPKPLLGKFQTSRGIDSDAELTRIEQHYGTNTFDIPVPTFSELFREHAVAPFFVFQVFCVGLWMLDEYWYYSLFTLVMLVMFESTVVWQRQRTLSEFRSMGIKPYDVWAYRLSKWTEVSSDRLLPGDLVSVSRTKEDSGVACDMLLVEGTAIVNEAMLSGESTPLLKDSVQLRPADAPLDPEGLDKNAFLWGGTKVLQITHGNSEDAKAKPASGVPKPPDDGAMAIVIKTGFETSQGSLVRTMIYSTERVSANNAEALLFILFLLVFAIAASWYVWDEGVRKDRKRSKLLLDCVLIITSVVPPELPMELSLAVNTSLAALAKFAIFCTEPFRIPFAGRIDVACFDKTGTLTGEDLVVEGIAGLDLSRSGADVSSEREADGAHSHITPVHEASLETVLVLATAHALVKLDEGEVVGDPMEKATLSALGWTLGRNDILSNKAATAGARTNGSTVGTVQIKRRFQFSSALKRQSSVATVAGRDAKTGQRIQGTFVAVKGAPETIMKRLVSVPNDYEETYKYFTRMGSRVLALAFKQLTVDHELGAGKINDLKREDVEAGLTFAGFLVLHCPLKDDAKEAVQMLNESSHRVVMITGDNPLTAVHVAREVEIVDREVLILDVPDHSDGGKDLVWHSVDDKVRISVDPTKRLDPDILRTKDLCVTGYALSQLKDQPAWLDVLRYTWVYARVSPKQKEDILLGLKDMGYYTLMAGDGTNDVGALKQAHIGVALLNGTPDDLTRIAEHARNTKMKELYQKQVDLMKRWNQAAPPVPVVIAHLYPAGPSNPHLAKAVEREAARKNMTPEEYTKAFVPSGGDVETITSPAAQQLLNQGHNAPRNQMQQKAAGLADQLTASMMDSEMNEDEPPTLKLGDASVAAPFTSKLRNVIAIPNIIRQGRCTLVATIQMYKILALNCLISAYSLSVLYLEGIKFGDGQYTISGMLMSVCFLSISRARSVEGLSKERPQPNIFNFYIIGSILGQFAVHVTTLIYIARFCDKIAPRGDDIDLEADFTPSLLNSAVYLLQLIQQISTFAVNYQGRPFRESLSENKGMYYGIVGVTGIAFACSTEFVPELNEMMKLVPFSSEFKTTMTAVMAIDYAACYVIEVILKFLFSDLRARDIAERRPDQLERERVRKKAEQLRKAEEEDKQRLDKVAVFEQQLLERRQRLQAARQGR